MKLNKIIRLSVLMLAAVFLFAGCLSATYEYGYDGAEEYSTDSLKYFGNRIHNVQIHWYSGKVTFIESDAKLLDVVEQKILPAGSENSFNADKTPFLDDAEKMHWYVENVETVDPETQETVIERTLHIEYCEANYMEPIASNNKHLVVQVPPGVNITAEVYNADVVIEKANLGSLTLSTTGGDVQIGDLNVENMSIASVSGLVKIQNLTAKKNIQILNTTGLVKIDSVQAESMSVNNPLRGVDLENVMITDSINLQSTAGLLNVGKVTAKEATISSVSGGVNVGLVVGCEKVNINTETGGVFLTLADALGATLEFNTVSGRLKCDSYSQEGNKYIIAKGVCKLQVNTTSGNLSIKLSQAK